MTKDFLIKLENELSKIGTIDEIEIYHDPTMESTYYIFCRKGPELAEDLTKEGYRMHPVYKNNITRTVAIIGGSTDLNFYRSIILIKKFNL